MQNGVKKTFYIFLSALLGLLLFILLQRSLFLLAFLFGFDVLSVGFSRFDYGTFIVAMFAGLWYGIWVGLYWYQAVYEDRSVPGMFRGILARFGRNPASGMFSEEGKSWNLEDLMKVKVGDTEPSGINPSLRVFESNTIAFSASPPLHAKDLHGPVVKTVKSRRPVVKKPNKKVVKKTI